MIYIFFFSDGLDVPKPPDMCDALIHRSFSVSRRNCMWLLSLDQRYGVFSSLENAVCYHHQVAQTRTVYVGTFDVNCKIKTSRHHIVTYSTLILSTHQVMNLQSTLCVLHHILHKIHFIKMFKQLASLTCHRTPRKMKTEYLSPFVMFHISPKDVCKNTQFRTVGLLWCHTGLWHLSMVSDNWPSQL